MFIGCKTCLWSMKGGKAEYICNYGFMHKTTCLKRSGIDIRNYPGVHYSADTKQRCYLYKNKHKLVYLANPE